MRSIVVVKIVCDEIITIDYFAFAIGIIGLLSTALTLGAWFRRRKMSLNKMKELYSQSQRLVNEQQRVMDEGSEMGIHDEIAGEVYRTVSERKPIINEAIELMHQNLEMGMTGKKNYNRFNEIVNDSIWIVSTFYGENVKETEQSIEKNWAIFKQRFRKSIDAFEEIEKEYKTKKII